MNRAANAAKPAVSPRTDRAPPPPAGPGRLLRRWLAHPLRMASAAALSSALCRRIVAQSRWGADEAVLELGAGTGVVSRALLAAGLAPSRLLVVEIVPETVADLRRSLPGATVIEGDARYLPSLVPRPWHGRIGTVICGVKLAMLAQPDQRRFIDAIDGVAPGRGFLHYSYCITSPLPWRAHGLAARREAWTALNFPPASVWRYAPG